jgi:HD-GYP domain-containing protein (c-di-GMP phosphodiesterase class II)
MLRGIRSLRAALPCVLHHHERWDGSGYPHGLAGEAIPRPARIMAVADAFDAMTSTRPYRDALPVEVALGEVRRCAGTQFDPEASEAFLAAFGV